MTRITIGDGEPVDVPDDQVVDHLREHVTKPLLARLTTALAERKQEEDMPQKD